RLLAAVGVDAPSVRSSVSRLKRRGLLLPAYRPSTTNTTKAAGHDPDSTRTKAPEKTPTASPPARALRSGPPRQTQPGTRTIRPA
ncbi:hypothetical protein ACWEN3_39995, partial [Streptomyces sp. NPDC004561]